MTKFVLREDLGPNHYMHETLGLVVTKPGESPETVMDDLRAELAKPADPPPPTEGDLLRAEIDELKARLTTVETKENRDETVKLAAER